MNNKSSDIKQNQDKGKTSPKLAIEPIFEKSSEGSFDFRGFVGGRINANLDNWLLTVPIANPAMIQIFRDQERKPPRDLVPWAGEFVGKYLISAIQGWHMTEDVRLKVLIDRVIQELIDAQLPNGYLGPFPTETRLIDHWDVWGHYHWIQAFLMYYKDTGFEPALHASCKAADLIHQTYVGTERRMPSPEQNLGILHGACLLYKETGNLTYMELAEWVIAELDKPDGCAYIEDALAGKEIQDFHARRWEGLHCIQGICEMGFLTGDPKYHNAFEHIWWAMLKGDRHNTGGFTSAEGCQGNPYDQRAIEICCTIAWVALTIDMLRLTGNSLIADELELSTFNGVLGAQHPSGRWWTYNTPMDGVRKASAHDIVFQARAGSPELNCCSVNAPRGIGMLTEWALMPAKDGAVLNYYGPSTITMPLPSGNSLTIFQETEYPLGDKINVTIGLDNPEKFVLRLRIPGWSKNNRLSINGEDASPVSARTYFAAEREWKQGDRIELSLDLSLHFWAGERELQGKTSIYRGPILLTYDSYYNSMDPDDVPSLSAQELSGELVPCTQTIAPWMLFKFKADDGRDLFLCDFASAGATGTHYLSWLQLEGVSAVPFTRSNPMRIS